MARVRLEVADPPNRITLKMVLEQAGHEVVEDGEMVVICDNQNHAIAAVKHARVLLLAAPKEIPAAVHAMREGVYGYISLPLQPGEAEIMVSRALEGPSAGTEAPLQTLEEAEEVLILDTLRRCRQNQAETARVLGIGRNTLWRKLKRIKSRQGVAEDSS